LSISFFYKGNVFEKFKFTMAEIKRPTEIKGCIPLGPAADESDREFFLDRLLEKITLSILRCGDNSQVKYKEIFIVYKHAWIEAGYVDCALASVPYLVLAQQAVPPAGPVALLSLTLTEWEKAVGLIP
jgi:hypothetical protein